MDDKGHMYDSEKESIPKNRLRTLINLRFKAWLEYNKLKPDMITKIKMKQAFEAGFMAREVGGIVT